MTNFNFLLRKAWIKEIHLEKQHRMGSIKKKKIGDINDKCCYTLRRKGKYTRFAKAVAIKNVIKNF